MQTPWNKSNERNVFFQWWTFYNILSSKRRKMFLALSKVMSSGKLQDEHTHAAYSHIGTNSLKNSQLKKKKHHLCDQTPVTPSRNRSQPKMPVTWKSDIRARAVHKRHSHDTAFQTAQLHRYIRHLPGQLQSKDPKSPQKTPSQICWLVWLCSCLHLLFSWLAPSHTKCCIEIKLWRSGEPKALGRRTVHFPKGHQAENIHP